MDTMSIEIILRSHEGVICDTLDIEWLEKRRTIKNCKENWNWLKQRVDDGINVVVERKKWGGEIEIFNWVGSPSYICRFGK